MWSPFIFPYISYTFLSCHLFIAHSSINATVSCTIYSRKSYVYKTLCDWWCFTYDANIRLLYDPIETDVCVCFERKFNDRLENHVSSISCFGCDRGQKCENALNAGRASFVCYSLFNIFIFTVFKRLECGSLFKLKIPFFLVQENYQPQTSSEENIELFWLVICF